MSTGSDLIAMIASRQNLADYQKKHWHGTFAEYLDIVRQDPKVTRTAYQRVYDMILSHGVEEIIVNKDKVVRYKFFDDPENNGQDAIFGLDRTLTNLVNILMSAALRYGTERRVLLLHGPVGSSKSTIARLLKKGLENYSKTDQGALYTYGWREEGLDGSESYVDCPMHEEPLHLIPIEHRDSVLVELNAHVTEDDHRVLIDGDLCPYCRQMFNERMQQYDGDWAKVLGDVRARRLILSEQDRVGIGTFQPKDEKNQDATELTGDINYRKIAEYGTESDPRAFNFDGEFNIANRGIIEFIEVLKLDVAFLYDLLGASQEHKIKPKKFAQTDIDEVILGHTNEPEYKKLQSNEFMEALRDRTVKIDVPYVTRLADEVKIYEKDYNSRKVRGKRIAPHTLEVAAMWALLTRLEEPKNAGLTLLQKLKLYNGKTLPGFTEDNIKELREEAEREGMHGISPRYVQDKISNALVAHPEERSINPFMVLNELEAGLKHHSLINSDEIRKHYKHLLAVVKEEYEDIVKNEVQRAIAADEEALTRLCGNYIDNVKAYTQREKVKNKYTGQTEEPDERLMRSIEEKIDIPESRKDDFRREIMNYIGAQALDGKKFDYRTNERLQTALEKKLFQDQKDTIKLTSLVTSVVDKDTQEKIDIVKGRLIRNYGYDEDSATDVLNYVASIYARGDVKRGAAGTARKCERGTRRWPRPPWKPNGPTSPVPATTPALGYRLHRLTIDRYHRMVEAGVFSSKEPIFLWKGQLVEKMTKRSPHNNAMAELNTALVRLVPDGWHVRCEQPMTLGDDSEPEPDFTVVRGAIRDYAGSPITRATWLWSWRWLIHPSPSIPARCWKRTPGKRSRFTGWSTFPSGGLKFISDPREHATPNRQSTESKISHRWSWMAARSAGSAYATFFLEAGCPRLQTFFGRLLEYSSSPGIKFAVKPAGSFTEEPYGLHDNFRRSHPPAGFPRTACP